MERTVKESKYRKLKDKYKKVKKDLKRLKRVLGSIKQIFGELDDDDTPSRPGARSRGDGTPAEPETMEHGLNEEMPNALAATTPNASPEAVEAVTANHGARDGEATRSFGDDCSSSSLRNTVGVGKAPTGACAADVTTTFGGSENDLNEMIVTVDPFTCPKQCDDDEGMANLDGFPIAQAEPLEPLELELCEPYQILPEAGDPQGGETKTKQKKRRNSRRGTTKTKQKKPRNCDVKKVYCRVCDWSTLIKHRPRHLRCRMHYLYQVGRIEEANQIKMQVLSMYAKPNRSGKTSSPPSSIATADSTALTSPSISTSPTTSEIELKGLRRSKRVQQKVNYAVYFQEDDDVAPGRGSNAEVGVMRYLKPVSPKKLSSSSSSDSEKGEKEVISGGVDDVGVKGKTAYEDISSNTEDSYGVNDNDAGVKDNNDIVVLGEKKLGLRRKSRNKIDTAGPARKTRPGPLCSKIRNLSPEAAEAVIANHGVRVGEPTRSSGDSSSLRNTIGVGKAPTGNGYFGEGPTTYNYKCAAREWNYYF